MSTTTTTTTGITLYYHGATDLTDIRPEILNYGVTDFSERMEESESIINRALDAKWYRKVAAEAGVDYTETPFDPELVISASQLTRLACYKSLELIYLHLMKEFPEPDAFERQMGIFAKLYKDELAEVLLAGISYDFDESGDISSDERSLPVIRRLVRV